MPRKLNQKTEDALVKAIQDGLGMRQAARAAGIDPATFYRWLNRGIRGDYRAKRLVKRCREAQKTANEREVKTKTRALFRRNYDELLSHDDLAALSYREIMRLFKDARIPLAAAKKAIQMAQAELEDREEIDTTRPRDGITWASTEA